MYRFALCLLAAPALADPLPKDATPFIQAKVSALYAGHAAVRPHSMAVFTPDHAVKGIYNGKTLFWGSWTVKANEVCMMNQGVDPDTKEHFKVPPDCWTWWHGADGAAITLYSRHWDGTKPDLKDGYYDDEIGNLKPGDKVSAKFDPAWAKVGG